MADKAAEICTYEVEHTSTGEIGLLERQRRCEKNPNHKRFFPIDSFQLNDLPNEYQTQEMMDVVRIIAELTVRIQVAYTSMIRPTTYPGTDQVYPAADSRGCSTVRVGTGFISSVEIHNQQETLDNLELCPCYTCRQPKNISQTAWGLVSITTAAHVLCTLDELVHTKVDCFYNNDEDKDVNVKVLHGDTMRASRNPNPIIKVNVVDDFCQFSLITHDIDLCTRLSRCSLYDLLTMNLKEVKSSANHLLTMAVSHPHGCTKCVSWGTWISRDILNQPDEPEKQRYYYNMPTCPGSSGALVWLLDTTQNTWHKIYVHSAGMRNGLNGSGSVDMFSEFIKSAVQCHIS